MYLPHPTLPASHTRGTHTLGSPPRNVGDHLPGIGPLQAHDIHRQGQNFVVTVLDATLRTAQAVQDLDQFVMQADRVRLSGGRVILALP